MVEKVVVPKKELDLIIQQTLNYFYQLLGEVAGGTIAPRRYPKVSEREVEVLDFVVAGLTNKQIGERLTITPSTVRAHVRNLMGKYDVHNRTQLAVAAIQQKAH